MKSLRKGIGRIATAVILVMPFVGCEPIISDTFKKGIRYGVVEEKDLDEISGIVTSRRFPGVLWVHNDGGKGNFHAVSTNGQDVARFRLEADLEDLEDMAAGSGPGTGSDFLYLGDIGDNKRKRKFIRVYRFPEPDVNLSLKSDKRIKIRNYEVMKLRYPSKPRDAEALLIDPLNDDVLIVTKQGRRAEVYRSAAQHWNSENVVALEKIAEFLFGGVSGADISSDGTQIILRRENAARLWMRPAQESIAEVLRGPFEAVPVIGPPRERNGESIAFTPNGFGYYTIGEGKREAIYFFDSSRKEIHE